jgi:hypothetical protein
MSGAWDKAHPEKVRAYKAAWAKRNPEKERAKVAAWYKANKKKVAAMDATRRKANPEKHATKNATWAKANPEKVRAAMAKWVKANPAVCRANEAKRRALKAAALVPLTPEEQAKVIGIYAEARALSEMIGTPYHVDHIIPLSKGGLHHPSNLQVLRGTDNLKKGAKLCFSI